MLIISNERNLVCFESVPFSSLIEVMELCVCIKRTAHVLMISCVISILIAFKPVPHASRRFV
jgi:hypothetical protein